MANRCYQTVTLYGKSEEIKEVIDFVLLGKTKEFEDGTFLTDQFPISLCSIKDNNKIVLETKYASVGCTELSKLFPLILFKSSSYTEGYGEELFFVKNNDLIYSVYYNVDEERNVGNILNEEYLKNAFNVNPI